jgi:hypothetical protein
VTHGRRIGSWYMYASAGQRADLVYASAVQVSARARGSVVTDNRFQFFCVGGDISVKNYHPIPRRDSILRPITSQAETIPQDHATIMATIVSLYISPYIRQLVFNIKTHIRQCYVHTYSEKCL